MNDAREGGNGRRMPSNAQAQNGHVYIYNKTRETFVATEATIADSYFRRLVGLLGKTKRWAQLRPRPVDRPFSRSPHNRNAFSD